MSIQTDTTAPVPLRGPAPLPQPSRKRGTQVYCVALHTGVLLCGAEAATDLGSVWVVFRAVAPSVSVCVVLQVAPEKLYRHLNTVNLRRMNGKRHW